MRSRPTSVQGSTFTRRRRAASIITPHRHHATMASHHVAPMSAHRPTAPSQVPSRCWWCLPNNSIPTLQPQQQQQQQRHESRFPHRRLACSAQASGAGAAGEPAAPKPSPPGDADPPAPWWAERFEARRRQQEQEERERAAQADGDGDGATAVPEPNGAPPGRWLAAVLQVLQLALVVAALIIWPALVAGGIDLRVLVVL